MTMWRAWYVAMLICGLCSACAEQQADRVLVVRVYADPSGQTQKRLEEASSRFNLAMQQGNPHDRIVIAHYVTKSYEEDLQELEALKPQAVILNRETDTSELGEVAQRLGRPQAVCGVPAYVPDWTSPAERNAAQKFLQWLAADCRASKAAGK